MIMSEEVMLSIIVPTYGHERYIVQALDSIRMQKTKYRYEVLVGEDASPDHTRKILKEYDKRHPGIFQMFYRMENMYGKEISNARDLRLRAKGKYIICLEGDDYWISADKIEKQIDFLETHPEYIAVAHNCIVVDEYSKGMDEEYPECKHQEYTWKDYLFNILPGQTATVMYRNNNKEKKCFDSSIIDKGLVPGDKLLVFALLASGKVYCIQEKMSAYRHVKKGGTSFSANFVYDIKKDLYYHKELLKYAYLNKNKSSVKCAEILYFDILIRALTNKVYDVAEVWNEYKKLKHKFLILIGFLCKRIELKVRKR